MKFFILAACLVAVAFAAPSFRGMGQDKPSKDDIEELIELCEAMKDEERGEEPALEEMCKELAKMLEKGPKPTEDPSKRGDTEKAGLALVAGLNTICIGFDEISDAYERLDGGSKRSWDPVMEGLKVVCDDLYKTQMATLDLNKDGEMQREELKAATVKLLEGLIGLCQGLQGLAQQTGTKRSWESTFTGLFGVCMKTQTALEAQQKRKLDGGRRPPKTDEDGNTLPPPNRDDKPTKEEVEELIELCEALKDDDKRDDEPELEDVCRELAKMLKKGPKPTESSKRRGPKPPKTDEDGNTLPPPSKDDMPTKEEVEELIVLCEMLKDDDKRDDEPELEEICKELAKMLKKGPKPTESSKRRGPKPPKTDEDGNTLPPPSKDDMPTKEEVEELIVLCEMLKDDDKRDDEPELEEICKELAKMLKKGPKPTESSKRRGPKPPKTDEDGNTLPPPSKDDMPTKEEVEELIVLCEMLKDDDKRDDEPELEEICKELAKMLKKGPKPTESSKRRGPKPPRTDEDGNTLPPPSKDDMPTKEEVEELIVLCEMLKDDDKRDDEPELEEICKELAKMLEKGPKPTESSKRRGPKPPKTDEDGNTLPPPSRDDKPTKEEVEELIELCEALKDDDKRDDEPELEDVCRELAKMLKKGPRPTEASKRFW